MSKNLLFEQIIYDKNIRIFINYATEWNAFKI